MSDPESVLLYDGLCALCNGAVKLVLRFDRRRLMKFAALSGATGQRYLAEHPDLRSIDSIVLIEGGRAFVRSTAVLRIFRYLGGPWKLLLIGYLVPREIRDSLYDVVAYWRYRVFGTYPACPIPPSAVRERFLDAGG